MPYENLKIFTDGGARGNPGPAGIGAVAYGEDGAVVFEVSEYVGETTNNQAEYRALIAALEKAKDIGAKRIDVFMDSELIVKQMNREYRVKHQDLAPLFLKVHNLTLFFENVKFCHIPRAENKHADRLVNRAIDNEMKP
jgi:ribonuclease HI